MKNELVTSDTPFRAGTKVNVVQTICRSLSFTVVSLLLQQGSSKASRCSAGSHRPVPPWEVPLPARLGPGSVQDPSVNSVLVWDRPENVRVHLKRLDAPK